LFFVFSDNTYRRGYGGAAVLRDHPQTYGFVTKRSPDNKLESFYDYYTYLPKFESETDKLIKLITENQDKIFYISKLGAGLANRGGIFNSVIKPQLPGMLSCLDNVVLLWEKL